MRKILSSAVKYFALSVLVLACVAGIRAQEAQGAIASPGRRGAFRRRTSISAT